jgi:hypothetical protein
MKINDNEKEMGKLFDDIDVDHSGSIDKSELKTALAAKGLKVNMVAIEAMMQAADEDHDGKISKEEWIHMCHRVSAHHSFPTKYLEKPEDHSAVHAKEVLEEEKFKETHGRHDPKK